MLISRVPDEGERCEQRDFQSASELFDLMARDHDFDNAGDDPLTTSDLVLLYKNIDLGKQLMSNANEMRPNRRVESVVHDEPDSESELSECCSSERLDYLALVTPEDPLAPSSPSLAHKFPDLSLRTAPADYDRHFLFKDPYIKEQLKNLTLMSTTTQDSTVLPASLLDYICCKRLEDNSNFYMDNIIRYVNNTIEQLKRISNGDYLTERAKEKWREVENEKENESKVLTASPSIPLHVERKVTSVASKWDDLVHSEVDLRSLARILEKRVVLEVPRLISGSYKLLSNRIANNLVISCARAPKPAARLDVVLQLRSSDAGIVSQIDSIMILTSDPQSEPPSTESDKTKMLPLTYEVAEEKQEEEPPKIIELVDPEPRDQCASQRDSLFTEPDGGTEEDENEECRPRDFLFTETIGGSEENENEYRYRDSLFTETIVVSEEDEYSSICDRSKSEMDNQPSVCEPAPRRVRLVRGDVVVNLATPEDMRLTIRALPPLAPHPEPSDTSSLSKTKKNPSPTRVRVKSPYENKSHILEERKRRKLLEIRERRERKKLAMNESRMKKFSNKNAVAPQPSASVTKLSITNKSFYNSIFGQSVNVESKLSLTTKKKGARRDDVIPEAVSEHSDEETASMATDRGKKYVNRSYYLDDAVTEMMFLQMKGEVRASASTSAVSNDSAANLSQLSSTFVNLDNTEPASADLLSPTKDCPKEIPSKPPQMVPLNTPRDPLGEPAVECRRSIDKIYALMNTLGKEPQRRGHGGDGDPEMQTDSGTSLKHQVTSSNPSSFSFEKRESKDESQVIPKVIISSKLRPKPEPDKPRFRKPQSPRKTYPGNPLKAISQLLQEFDHVQKARQKTADSKSRGDVKLASRQEVQVQGRRRVGGREGKVSPRRVVAREGAGAGEDEAREARGEAVRGPPSPAPALSSRLQALAQPKRSYVQARADDLRNPRSQVGVREYRAPPPRARGRRDPAPPARPPLSSLDRSSRSRRSEAGSPEQRAPAPPPPAPAPAPPSALKKKMVAVESYVKQHYGRARGGSAGPGAPRAGHSARAPMLPSDLELGSSLTSSPMPGGSSELGCKLHHIIDSMLRAPPPPPQPKPDKDKEDRHKPEKSPDSPSSLTELARLEEALGRKVSTGAFSKRLRLKNHTLTPKHSARIVLLQSGDAASLILGAPSLKSETESIGDVDYRTLTLSTTRLDWRFTGMPMQISTVGYAFPTYDCNTNKLTDVDTIVTRKVLNETDEDSPFEDLESRDQVCQCFRASSPGLECAVQAVAADFATPDSHADPPPFEDEFLPHAILETPLDLNLSSPEIKKIADEESIIKVDVDRSDNSTMEEKHESKMIVEEKSEILDYTTSLDMLVGLLNEIQKITSNSYGSEEKVCASECELRHNAPEPSNVTSSSCVVSLESDTSIEKVDASTSKTETLRVKVECVNKEVSAQFPTVHEAVSVSTDVPSRSKLDLAVTDPDESTVVPVKPCSSTESLEYQTCSEVSSRVIDRPIAHPGYVKSLVLFHDAHAAKMKDSDVSVMGIAKKAAVRREKAIDNVVARVDIVDRSQMKKINKCCLKARDFDPMMRMKRDILVTVYSVLVLTVFAALSLPEMLNV